MRFSIICAANKPDVLHENLLKSPGISSHEIIVVFGAKNVPDAYNRGAKIATEEVMIFVHQDVFLPESFFPELESSLESLSGQNWGILGPIGAKLCPATEETLYIGDMVDRGTRLGNRESLPEAIQTLDEMMLICKKEDAIFDEEIPSANHMHGADICINSISRGKKNFAIQAFCYHNSTMGYSLPPEFYASAEYVRNKWKDYLPIVTTCTRLD